MERMSLAPGFRFHPTDVELVMYYLKKKVLGKKLFEAIAEVNIYKFPPEDLPDKSCLKSKDLEWFFFCPREKKYASGVRVKRDTEIGFWKTTGEDKSIYYDNRLVGKRKTLVFHLGRPRQGKRTNWLIHEYRIVDVGLATAGVQDTYVLCKVFKKDGLGPKNGAQYGAPFNEADWADDDVDVQNLVISPSYNALDMVSAPPEIQSSGLTEMVDPGSNTSLNEAGPSYTAGHPPNDVHTNELGDDIVHLFDSFKEDDTLPLNDNGNQDDYTLPLNDNGNQDDYTLPLNDNGNHEGYFSGYCFDGYGIYNGLEDLERCTLMNEEGMLDSGMQIDEYTLNGMLLEDDQFYIELNDLEAPLNCSHGATEHVFVGDIFGPYSHGNMAEDLLPDRAHYELPINWLPGLSRQSNREGGCSDMLEMVDHQDMEIERFDERERFDPEDMGRERFDDI